MEIGNTQKT